MDINNSDGKNDKSFGNNDFIFNVLTLNCWGLWFVSKHKNQRIKAIAQHLNEQNYDFVFLQEVWCSSDFEFIRSSTRSKYKFAHLYRSPSLLGTSGLAILSKWKPTNIHYEPFVVNGTPFRPHHGDWFAGKGTAYAKVEVDSFRFHLFCVHMHAQYMEDEKLDDQYSIH